MVNEGPKYANTEYTPDPFASLKRQRSDQSSSSREFIRPQNTFCSNWSAPGSSNVEYFRKMQTPLPQKADSMLARSSFSKSYTDRSPAAQAVALQNGPFILAFIPNKGREVGFAKCNLRTMKIVLTQFLDDTAYSGAHYQLASPAIVEAIFPATIAKTPLIASLRSALPAVTFCAIARRFFSDVDGNCILEANAHITRLDVQGKYLCLAALTALIRYISDVQHIVLSPAALNIEYQCREEYLEISTGTVHNLQLLTTSSVDASPYRSGKSRKRQAQPKSRGAQHMARESSKPAFRHIVQAQRSFEPFLSDFVDFAGTLMGKRFLLASIAQPLSNLQTIELRQAAVHFFLQNPIIRTALSDALSGMPDIEHLIAFFVAVPKKIDPRTVARKLSNILCLYSAIGHVQETHALLEQLLPDSSVVLLDAIKASCSPEGLTTAMDTLAGFLNEHWTTTEGMQDILERDCDSHLRPCFALKQGLSSVLDTSRGQYREVVRAMIQEAGRLQEMHAIPSLRLTFNAPKGYGLIFDKSAMNRSCSDVFLQQSVSGKRVHCTTREIANWNTQCTDLVSEIMQAANGIADDLIKRMQQHMPTLYRATDAITLLDFLLSLATAARSWGTPYAQPKLSAGASISMQNACSPIIWAESGCDWSNVQGNDCHLGDPKSLMLLSGPNMAGKTSYLQLVGQMCVLAHIGSMVPASSCTMPLIDRICTRMGFDDDIAHDASSFAVEMMDIAHILSNATTKSLVLIDEVGRSTHHNDAAAISLAIMDSLLRRHIPAIYVTHQFELHKLQAKHANMRITHFLVGVERGKLRFSNKLLEGESTSTHYGIELAGNLGFPREVVRTARSLLSTSAATQSSAPVKTDEDYLRAACEAAAVQSAGSTSPSPTMVTRALSHAELLLNLAHSQFKAGESIVSARAIASTYFSFVAQIVEQLKERRLNQNHLVPTVRKEKVVDMVPSAVTKEVKHCAGAAGDEYDRDEIEDACSYDVFVQDEDMADKMGARAAFYAGDRGAGFADLL